MFVAQYTISMHLNMFKCGVIFCISITFVICYEVVPISRTKWTQPYSPFYDAASKSLYFSDFVERTVNRYDLGRNRFYSALIEGDIAPTFIIPVKGCKNRFIVSNTLTITVIEWNGRDQIASVIRDAFSVEQAAKYSSNSWNMAKVSPKFDFYGGTFREELCASAPGANAGLHFHKKSTSDTVRLLSGLKLSGGLDWNVNENLFYHIDCCRRILQEFDWNPKTGSINNGRIVYRFKNYGDDAIIPLGLTIDTEGYLYAASYFGGEVLKINPRTSRVVKRIKIPAEAVAAVTFGGPNNDILFVLTEQQPFNTTTGGLTTRRLSPENGSIYMVKGLKAKGFTGRKLLL